MCEDRTRSPSAPPESRRRAAAELHEQQKKLDDSLKKAKQDVESIAESPSSSSNATANQQATEQRVASASARLDDALQTVREDTPAPTDKADHQKDSNHQ